MPATSYSEEETRDEGGYPTGQEDQPEAARRSRRDAGALEEMPPKDPTIKALVNEESGDGIMSAITFNREV